MMILPIHGPQVDVILLLIGATAVYVTANVQNKIARLSLIALATLCFSVIALIIFIGPLLPPRLG